MAKSDVLVRMKADTSGYDANIAKARRQLDQFKKENLTAGGAIKQLSGTLLSSVASFASVTAAAGALSSAISSNIEIARGFEKSMSQLSSLTGMTGKDLEKLKGYAIELGASTTLSASQVADAFKMIGSQQPQLLASGEALKEVTKYAITLSEAAGIELSTAAQTLSTSINQMGGDSANASRYVNVLAAASQKGAGDIAWLGEALTKSATAAKAVGTDYEELVANLEQLAKAGFDASTAGTALRSIIMNLEKQANDNYKPSVVGLTQAFQNLSDAHLNITQYQGIVGKMFATQAMALADAAGAAKEMTTAITGTNIAEEQAKINTENLDGALKSLSSAWEGLNLHINDSNGPITTFVNNLTTAIRKVDAAVITIKYLWKVMKGDASIGEDSESGADGSVNTNAITNIPEVVVTGNAPKKPKKPKSSTKTVKTEEQQNNEEIQKLTQEYIKASEQRQAAIRDEIKVLQDRNAVIQQMKDEALGKMKVGGISSVEGVTPMSGENPLEKYKDSAIGLVTPLQQLQNELKNLQEAQAKAWSPEVFAAYEKRIQEVQGEMNVFKGIKSSSEDMAKSWRIASSAISSVGSAMSGLKNPAIDIMTAIGQAIATIGLAYAETLAKDSTSKSNIYSFIAAAAASTISLATTIAQFHSATGYAQGGMIKGNSYSGDNIGGLVDGGQLVGLNAGEIVLNNAQQSTLAQNLQGSGFGGNMRLVTRLSGSDLLLSIERTGQVKGYGQLMFWKGN